MKISLEFKDLRDLLYSLPKLGILMSDEPYDKRIATALDPTPETMTIQITPVDGTPFTVNEKEALGKHDHPRRSYYTTNGDVQEGPLDDLLETSEGILFGGDPDDGLLPFICRLDAKDEVDDPQNWEKANPSLPYRPSLRSEIEKEYKDVQYYSNATEAAALEAVEWYKTANNRKKLRSGSASYWWERSPYSSNSAGFCFVTSGGTADANSASDANGLAPFGCI